MIYNANCYILLKANFERTPWKTLLIFENGKTITFAGLELKSAQYARILKQKGVKKGDRICIQIDRSYESLCLYVACLRMGAVYVPINSGDGRNEIEYIIKNIEPVLIFSLKEKDASFEEIPSINRIPRISFGQGGLLSRKSKYLLPLLEITQVEPGDAAYILYTSGTTSLPKGVIVSHKSVALSVPTLSKIWGLTTEDVVLLTPALSHNLGVTTFNIALYSKCRILFPSSSHFEKIIKFLPLVTVFFGTPWLYKKLNRIKETKLNLTKARLLISGTNPLSKNTYQEFLSIYGKKIIDRYGMTETIVNTSNEIGKEIPGSCGKAIPGVEIRITNSSGNILPPGEVGFIEVRSPYLFTGYWKNKEKTIEVFRGDGYFITGDIGKLDENGYLYFTGRSKDIIEFNGLKVFAGEVENYIDSFPEVEGVAVFGVPCDQYEECLIAVVQLEKNIADITPEMIIGQLSKIINKQKLPKQVFFIKELPRNNTGKIQKNILYENYKNFFSF